MLPDLDRELMVAAGRMSMAALRQLVRLGADRRFVVRLTGAGLLGVAHVSLGENDWAPGGEHGRLLLGVLDAGELVDIVALSSTNRDEWRLRTGMGWALGAGAIENARSTVASTFGAEAPRVRLRMHATPFDWLSAGGAGICVLDWNAASLMELRSLGERVTLEVPAGGAERIKNLLAYGALPRVTEIDRELSGGLAA